MIKKINNAAEIFFTILWICIGYLQTSCYTFGNKIITFVLWPTIAVGGVLLLINIFHFKNFLKDKKNWLLILFCLSFLISTLVMYNYGIYKNVRLLVFLFFQFFILYFYNQNSNKKDVEKKLKIYLGTFLVGTLILTTISLVHLFTGYSKAIININSPHLVYGFTWGRLFGAYWDPNIASVICSVSLAILLYIFETCKNKVFKILSIFFFIMQIVYITFSDSRTGRICIIASVVGYVLFYIIKKLFKRECKKTKAFYIKSIFVIIFTIVLTIFIPIGIKYSYNRIATITNTKEVIVEKNGNKKKLVVINSETIKTKKVGRGYNLNNDISNKRFDIWKSGFEIFKKNILFGVSRANIVQYAHNNLPKTFIVNNPQMDFNSMHNLYIDILVSQGLFGFLPFIMFLILSLINIIKNIKKIITEKYLVLFITIALTELVATLVMTEIVYVDSPISTIFWLGLGYINYLCLANKEKSNLIRKINTKKMLVGYITNSNHSGINKYLDIFLEYSQKKGYTIELIGSDKGKYVDEILKKFNCKHYIIPSLKHPIKRYRVAKKIIYENKYDIVYTNISESFNCLTLLAAYKCKVENIIAHSHSSFTSGKTKIIRMIRAVLNWIFKPILSNICTRCCACSLSAGKWLFTKKTIKSDKFRLIYNSIDFNKFEFSELERKKNRKKYGISDNQILLGNVGNLIYQKNQIFALKILKSLVESGYKNYKLMIIGVGALEKDLKQYVSDNNLNDYVIFTGSVNNVNEIINSMDVFLFPSRFEGFGIAALEAEANGLSTLISNKVPADVVINSNAKIIPLNIKEWTNEILNISIERKYDISKENYNKFNNNKRQLDFILGGKNE